MMESQSGAAAPAAPGKGAKRRGGLELARIIACCCIIVIHQNFLYSTQYPGGSFLRMLTKGCATTIFFMITGAFLKAGQPFAIQIKRLVVKNVIPFLLVTPLILQFWPALAGQVSPAACFSQWNVTLRGFFTMLFAMNVDAIVSPHGYPAANGGIYHLWFMFALYKCYVFFPLLKPLLVDGSAGESAKRYALAIGAVVFLLVPTIKLFVPADGMLAKMPDIQLEPFLWLWVMLAGNHLYFRLRDAPAIEGRRRRAELLCGLVYLGATAFTYFLTMRHALEADGVHANDRFLDRGFIPLFAANVAAFVFFAILRIESETVAERIRLVANRTLYIYLFHVPVLALLRTHVFPDMAYYGMGDKLLVLAIVFLVCYILASICRGIERGLAGLTARRLAESLVATFVLPSQMVARSLRVFTKK